MKTAKIERVTKTIYIPQPLWEQLKDCKSVNAKIIDLIQKGIAYEAKGNKLTAKLALECLVKNYNINHSEDRIIIN